MEIIFATQNKSKIREASEILGPGFELHTPSEFGVTEDIPETGDTFRDNSLQKALYLYERTGRCCFSDDSGLEVDALGGAPGVHTARYAGPQRSADANIDKLLSELERVGAVEPSSRRARFRTCATLILPPYGTTEPKMVFFEGVMEGRIALERHGQGGFGYDPVFIPDDGPGCTCAELTEEAKNAISHRGKALRALAECLT